MNGAILRLSLKYFARDKICNLNFQDQLIPDIARIYLPLKTKLYGFTWPSIFSFVLGSHSFALTRHEISFQVIKENADARRAIGVRRVYNY